MTLGEIRAVDFPERLDSGVAMLLGDVPILVAMAMIQSFSHAFAPNRIREKRSPSGVFSLNSVRLADFGDFRKPAASLSR
jgi:hypothetical protein